ncbi:hypothetical protein QBC34DRAFT_100802 [Podospora aff. communis PSN243]|uniref:Mid2 domain-containing protein n=1 Tax=Podospora aff. communis PSN243 TaxID=3040156 RepID=A0AAV9GNG0_9PEZI|nr:hypothetical protein QBC34DRAFT_100802 [Podospora aff. communis PSN243]
MRLSNNVLLGLWIPGSVCRKAPVPAHGMLAPLQTPGPVLGQYDLQKRQDDNGWGEICGYVRGDARSPFGCAASSTCRTDTRASVIHCCPATPAAGATCVAMTACLDSTAFTSLTATRATSSNPISYETGWCTSSAYPSCVQYLYATSPLSGFTWLQCGKQATREVAILSATTGTETTPGSTVKFTPAPLPTVQVIIITATPIPPASTSESSLPVGAIVGGAVGGLAVICLLIFGLFYVYHHKKKHRGDQPIPQHDLGYGPPADFRGSMVKEPYYGSPLPSPQFQRHELPVESGDRQLREMPG